VTAGQAAERVVAVLVGGGGGAALRVTVAPVIGALVAEEVTVPLIWVTGTWEKLDQMTLEPVVLVPPGRRW